MSEHKMTKEDFLRCIRGWKFYWMMEEDGYQERAFSVDSNMMHDLANRLMNYKPYAPHAEQKE